MFISSTETFLFFHFWWIRRGRHWRRKWHPTPVFLPVNPRDGGAWWAAVYGVAQSQTRPKWLSGSSNRRGRQWLTGFQGSAADKESACTAGDCRSHRFHPWVGKIPWLRELQPTPVFLPGKSHGRRSLTGGSWGHRVLHDWATNTFTFILLSQE